FSTRLHSVAFTLLFIALSWNFSFGNISADPIICNAFNSASAITDPGPSSEYADLTVDEILSRMSLREKIGQLFFIRSYGYFKGRDSEDFQKIARLIKEYNIGGVTFFAGNVCGQAILTNAYQKMADLPLWISEDAEYGMAMRAEGTTRLPPAMA